MPRYLVERSLPPLSQDELASVGRRAAAAAEQIGITWIKSYYSAQDGKSYCEFEAPNAELVTEHARLAQLPIAKVYPIDLVVDPAMFK